MLHPTGTCWINLGDSYATGTTAPRQDGRRGLGEATQKAQDAVPRVGNPFGCKTKDLIGIPWMVAFALRADGWYLRSEIIWHKKAPMPESVRDRPTKAHEQLFLLSKSREYFYDSEAIAEAAIHAGVTVRTNGNDGMDAGYDGNRTRDGFRRGVTVGATRNKRSVWTLGPESYGEAHFAVMPTKLVEPCILAGTSAHGCCAECGAAWERVLEPDERIQAHWNGTTQDKALAAKGKHGATSVIATGSYQTYKTVDWQPTCTCNADVVPCTVLDPFNGSGTTGAVALKHGRKYIGIDLNPDYLELAHKRIRQAQPMLLEVTA